MTAKQVTERVLTGQLVMVGEWRQSKAEIITYRDKKDGRMKTMPVLRHTVETDTESISVSERVPDDFKPSDYKSPYKKGDKIVVRDITLFMIDKGAKNIRGMLEIFQSA